MLKKLLLSVLLLFMVGCVASQGTVSLIQEGKWDAVGVQDGVRGLPSRSMNDLESLAQQAGVGQMDINAYEAGYNQGIDRYCDVNNAYDIGLSGMQYLGVCANRPDGLRFQMDWQRGFEDFQSADQTF